MLLPLFWNQFVNHWHVYTLYTQSMPPCRRQIWRVSMTSRWSQLIQMLKILGWHLRGVTVSESTFDNGLQNYSVKTWNNQDGYLIPCRFIFQTVGSAISGCGNNASWIPTPWWNVSRSGITHVPHVVFPAVSFLFHLLLILQSGLDFSWCFIWMASTQINRPI